MRAENQDLPFHEVTKILGNMWSQLPSNQKQVLFGVLKLFCCSKILQCRSIGKLLVCNQGLPPFGNHKITCKCATKKYSGSSKESLITISLLQFPNGALVCCSSSFILLDRERKCSQAKCLVHERVTMQHYSQVLKH